MSYVVLHFPWFLLPSRPSVLLSWFSTFEVGVTFMTPLKIYILMDLFLCVFGVSLLYEIFGVCGSVSVVTAMGASLSLSRQRPGIQETSELHGRLSSVLNPSFQQLILHGKNLSGLSLGGWRANCLHHDLQAIAFQQFPVLYW